MVEVSLLDMVSLHGTERLWPDAFHGLVRKLEESPAERTQWGVVADWCDEHGEPELAGAFRWVMRHRNVVAEKVDGRWGLYKLPFSLSHHLPIHLDKSTLPGVMAALAQAIRIATEQAKKVLEDLA